METYIPKKTCTKIFIALLLIIAEKPGHSPGEWRNKLRTNEYYWAIKGKRIIDKGNNVGEDQKHAATKKLDHTLTVC